MSKRPGPAKRAAQFAAALLLDDDARMELSKFRFAARYLERGDPNRSLLPLFSFLQDGSAFGMAYARNFLENYSRFHSQVGQDCFVDTWLEGKTGGTFMEIGVGDGERLSNSFFLEKQRGWTGVLCEPSRAFAESIAECRSAPLVPLAIHPVSGETLTYSEDPAGAYRSSAGNAPMPGAEASYPVQTISFADLADQYLGTQTIDYLSLDIEGNETAIIRSIDLNRYDIRVLSIEHNKDLAVMQDLIRLLTPYGYRYYDNGHFDWDIVFYK